MGQTCEACDQKQIEYLSEYTIRNPNFQKQYNLFRSQNLFDQSLKQYILNSDVKFVGKINQNNQKQGYGEIRSKQKIYAGNFVNDKPHGKGILIDRNYCYIGDFVQGKPSGKGQQRKAQIQFIGQYLNGKKLMGKLTHPEYVYEGHFKDNHFDGKGKIYYAGHEITYQGSFKNGKFHGQGLINYKNKYKYEGQFNQGIYHGKGLMLTQCGQIFQGKFQKGIKHGQGRVQTTQGHQIKAQWVNGNRNGKGFLLKKGEHAYAEWKQDKIVIT